MDCNHDGQISQEEFIEVGFIRQYMDDVLSDFLFIIPGLYETEEVLHDANVENNRCFCFLRVTI